MAIKITNYSCYDKGVTSKTENVSNIIDKMIFLAAKLTERFASDIVYDIYNLQAAVQNKDKLDHILFFREQGVETVPTEKLDEERYDSLLFNFTPIQIWRLTHDPVETETTLIRVSIYKESFPLK